MIALLPSPQENQAYFNVTPLEAGKLSLREEMLVSEADPNSRVTVPSLSFLLQHSSSKYNILFDLGIKKDISLYSPAAVQRIKQLFQPCVGSPDILTSFENSGIGLLAADITHVILSHVHWDHVGDHEPFSNARFILGGSGKPLLQSGYPYDLSSIYSRSTVPDDRTIWLESSGWSAFGPFERSYDFFGDGSLYIVDAPGHMVGHINAMVRTSPDGGWMLLAGDSAHDTRLLTGEKQIGHYKGSDGKMACMHSDEEKAKDHIRRITQLPDSVKICLAHDPLWEEKFKTR